MKKPVCADLDCNLEMELTCVGAYVLEHDHVGQPYLLWACDLFTCPGCGHQVAANHAPVPTARRGDDDFERLIALAERENRLVRRRDRAAAEPPADGPEMLQILIFHCDGCQTDVYGYRSDKDAEDAYWKYWADFHGIERGDEDAVQEIQAQGRTYVEWTEAAIQKGDAAC